MNIEERNLNKIPENQIQIKTITKLGLSQECKLSLTSSKKSEKWKKEKMWLSQQLQKNLLRKFNIHLR